jgi:N-acetylglucosaminyldiphosphoundecaprenol N-acetyl-beta-D-mannosaminyltransferase
LGVPIHALDFDGLLAQVEAWVGQDGGPARCRQICTVNPEFIVDTRRNACFANALLAADLRVPDGIGLLWASRFTDTRLGERVTGSDGIYRICERAAERGWSVFFLGAAPGVAEQTAAMLRACYPRLVVGGAHGGSPDERDWPQIQAYLDATKPKILFVAYGHPRQDIWIHQHLADFPADIAIGVGGAFDFVAGVTRRAPLWMQRAGIEWLHRLVHQPWRARRMMKLPLFVGLVIRDWGKQIVNCE